MNILLAIPSYRREAAVNLAIETLSPLLTAAKQDGINIRGYIYAQGYATQAVKAHPEFEVNYVPHVVRPIGSIMYDSVKTTNYMDSDFVIMSDDDVFYHVDGEHETAEFLGVLKRTLAHMKENDVAVGYAMLSPTWRCFATANFPKDCEFAPYKERFILLNTKYVDRLMKSDFQSLCHGEDTFIGIKAAILGLKSQMYYGFDNWVHIGHSQPWNPELPNVQTQQEVSVNPDQSVLANPNCEATQSVSSFEHLVRAAAGDKFAEEIDENRMHIFCVAERYLGTSVYDILPNLIKTVPGDYASPLAQPLEDWLSLGQIEIRDDEIIPLVQDWRRTITGNKP